jgi:hypothetical protein
VTSAASVTAFAAITAVFERHGACTIETPVFELKETLTGKCVLPHIPYFLLPDYCIQWQIIAGMAKTPS